MIEVSDILSVSDYLENIKVVVFDLDDTLYSETDYVISGYKSIAELFPESEDFFAKLWKCFKKVDNPIDFVLKEEEIYSEDLKKKCLEIYRNHFPDIRLYDGVLEMLLQFREEEKKLALITDGRPEGQNAKIDALNIRDIFQRIVITDELGGPEFRKPNPKAFELIKDYFSCQYNEMVYIGDNISKDFVSPNNLGMKSIFFNNPNGLYRFD